MKRILVIDDEPEIRKLLVSRLEHCGYEVDTAQDGQEALAKYTIARSANPYDLIILDISMPHYDGKQVLEAIRKDEKSRKLKYDASVPIIVLTADQKGYLDLFNRGCDDYLTKPFKSDVLLEKVRVKLSLRD